MKTTIQNLAVLILLISTMNVYSQEYGSHGIREDSSRPIAGLTIQEIRNAVYGVPAYQEGKTVIGSDSALQMPIWDLTADCSVKLLSGDDLSEVLAWLDGQLAAGGEQQ